MHVYIALVFLALVLFSLVVPESSAQYAFAAGNAGVDEARGVATDADGNVFVTGRFSFAVDFDPGSGEAVLVTDQFGDAFVASYNDQGGYRWVFALPRTGEGSGGLAIAHAPPHDLVTAGYFALPTDFDPGPGEAVLVSPCGDGGGFLSRYGDGGVFRWAFPLGGCLEDNIIPGRNMANGVALTEDGEAVVGGGFRGMADFDPGANEALLTVERGTGIFLAKYGADGSYRWALGVSGDDPPTDTGEALAVATSPEGGAIMTGYFALPADFDPDPVAEHILVPIGDAGNFDAFVASYDAEGGLRWAFNLGSPNEDTESWSVASDALSNVYVTGSIEGPTDFDPDPDTEFILAPISTFGDAFLASYDESGLLRWALVLGSPDGRFPDGRSVMVDTEGNLLVTGTGLSFASYTSNGEFQWSFFLREGEGNGTVFQAAVLPDTRFAAVGSFLGPVDFDPGPGEHLLVQHPGDSFYTDLFVATYAEDGRFPTSAEVPGPANLAGSVRVAPNPSWGEVHVTVSVPTAQPIQVAMYDALGRRVAVLFDGVALDGVFRLDVPIGHLAPGLYLVRAEGNTFRATQTLTRVQ